MSMWLNKSGIAALQDLIQQALHSHAAVCMWVQRLLALITHDYFGDMPEGDEAVVAPALCHEGACNMSALCHAMLKIVVHAPSIAHLHLDQV